MIFSTSIDRACYLEGTVTDAETGLPINGANIEILSEQWASDQSNAEGKFSSGLATAGTYQVMISNANYNPKEVSVTLENGIVTILDIELEAGPVSTQNLLDQYHINVFPNPTQDVSYIQFQNYIPKQARIKLYDSKRSTVLVSKVNQESIIDLSNLSPGAYFYEVIEGISTLSTGKIIKQ